MKEELRIPVGMIGLSVGRWENEALPAMATMTQED